MGALAAAALLAVLLTQGGDDDGGGEPATGGGFVGGDLHSLVADPDVPGRLFVGGHEAVSVSLDRGATWSRVDTLDNADAMGWAFAGEAVWVSGHPGINRSSDGARSFERANDGLPDTDVHAFGATPSVRYGAGPGAGVIASTDGASWETRADDAGQAFFGRILVDPADDEHLVAADAQQGVVESTDGGRSWRGIGGPPTVLWVSRQGETFYASGPSGASVSVDGGRTWEPMRVPAGASIVEADPGESGVLYAAVHTGNRAEVWTSRDGGSTWGRA